MISKASPFTNQETEIARLIILRDFRRGTSPLSPHIGKHELGKISMFFGSKTTEFILDTPVEFRWYLNDLWYNSNLRLSNGVFCLLEGNKLNYYTIYHGRKCQLTNFITHHNLVYSWLKILESIRLTAAVQF